MGCIGDRASVVTRSKIGSGSDTSPDEATRWYREHTATTFSILTDHNYPTSVSALNDAGRLSQDPAFRPIGPEKIAARR